MYFSSRSPAGSMRATTRMPALPRSRSSNAPDDALRAIPSVAGRSSAFATSSPADDNSDVNTSATAPLRVDSPCTAIATLSRRGDAGVSTRVIGVVRSTCATLVFACVVRWRTGASPVLACVGVGAVVGDTSADDFTPVDVWTGEGACPTLELAVSSADGTGFDSSTFASTFDGATAFVSVVVGVIGSTDAFCAFVEKKLWPRHILYPIKPAPATAARNAITAIAATSAN